MTDTDAQKRKAVGEQMLKQLGDLPVVYAFACELPAAHGEPLADLDRLWYDRFEAEHRDWFVILNGKNVHAHVNALGITLEGGTAYVLADETRLAKLTPVDVTWYVDPDTEERLDGPGADEADQMYWHDTLIKVLYERLTDLGKDLPPLEDILEGEIDGEP